MTRLLQRKCACGSGRHQQCDECSTKRLQRQPDTGRVRSDDARVPGLERRGEPLGCQWRRTLEPLYRTSFADVRVHDDESSHRAARSLDARAFTIGRHLYFAAGQYRPAQRDGLHLLAHELAHTVQQGPARAADPESVDTYTTDAADSPFEHEAERAADAVVEGRRAAVAAGSFDAAVDSIQTQPTRRKKPAAPKKLGDPNVPADVVLLMDDKLMAEALTLAPGGIILKVTSVEEMTRELGRVQSPFKSLFILSHSLSSGDLGFEQGDTTTYVQPKDVASAIQSAIPPDRAPSTVDFRGCSVGTTPAAMDQIRVAAGAQAAIGGNCFMVQKANGPITLRGKAILKRSDIRSGDEKAFQKGLTMLRQSFKEAEKCIIDSSEDAYFRANGKIVALWANDSFSEAWDERASKCYSALTREVVPASEAAKKTFEPMVAGDCKLVRVEAAVTAGDTGTGKGTSPKPEESR